MKENNFDSDSLKEQPSTEANEIELFKKIQVMQTMNPAIKALMNYRGKSVIVVAYWSSLNTEIWVQNSNLSFVLLYSIGINLFPWINKLEENAQKIEKGPSAPNSDLTTEMKRFSSPCTFQEDHKVPGANTFTSPLVSTISHDSSPFPNSITPYSTPMLLGK